LKQISYAFQRKECSGVEWIGHELEWIGVEWIAPLHSNPFQFMPDPLHSTPLQFKICSNEPSPQPNLNAHSEFKIGAF